MNEDIEAIKAYATRLRADLAATNAMLFALLASIPAVYQEKVLTALAARSAGRQAHAEQSGIPGAEEALRLAQAAEERLYQELQKVFLQSARDLPKAGQ